MPVTIYESAARAGVSSSTIARVLRGDVRESRPCGAATARLVRQLANEMGYRPNLLPARAFSRGQTHDLGLLCSKIVNSLVCSLPRHGYHLALFPVDLSRDREEVIVYAATEHVLSRGHRYVLRFMHECEV